MALTSLDAISVDSIDIIPDLQQLTTKSLDGTGVFDVLMKTVNIHLKEEFDKGRINGVQYSDVYLGALGAVLQQSISFLLNQQNDKKVAAEIGLIRQKTVTELANTGNNIPDGLGFNESITIEGLIKSKLDLDILQGLLITSNTDANKAEKALVGQKVITELSQTDSDIGQALIAGYGFNDSNLVTGIMESKIAQAAEAAKLTEQEVALVTQKVLTEVETVLLTTQKTSLTEQEALILTEKVLAEKETLLLTKQKTKIAEQEVALVTGKVNLNTQEVAIAVQKAVLTEQEAALIEQKVVTELTQTSITIPSDLGKNVSTVVEGMVKSQKAKTDAEAIFLSQKAITELAQTSDSVPTDTPALTRFSTIFGSIGKQKELYTAQTKGFARDAEQKLAKMMVDAWSVDATVGNAEATAENQLYGPSLGAVITKAKEGIGLVV